MTSIMMLSQVRNSASDIESPPSLLLQTQKKIWKKMERPSARQESLSRVRRQWILACILHRVSRFLPEPRSVVTGYRVSILAIVAKFLEKILRNRRNNFA